MKEGTSRPNIEKYVRHQVPFPFPDLNAWKQDFMDKRVRIAAEYADLCTLVFRCDLNATAEVIVVRGNDTLDIAEAYFLEDEE
jgi:hypothetical protein